MYSPPSLLFFLSFFTEYSIPAVYGRRLVSNARLHKWKEAPILPSRNIIAIAVVGSTQLDEPADHDIPPNSPYFSASSTVWSSSSIPSVPVRGTFTPVYAGSCGGTVSPGGI